MLAGWFQEIWLLYLGLHISKKKMNTVHENNSGLEVSEDDLTENKNFSLLKVYIREFAGDGLPSLKDHTVSCCIYTD